MRVERTQFEDIEAKQLIWYGPLKIIHNQRLPKKVKEWTSTKFRKRGEPRKTWNGGILKALSSRNLREGYNDIFGKKLTGVNIYIYYAVCTIRKCKTKKKGCMIRGKSIFPNWSIRSSSSNYHISLEIFFPIFLVLLIIEYTISSFNQEHDRKIHHVE